MYSSHNTALYVYYYGALICLSGYTLYSVNINPRKYMWRHIYRIIHEGERQIVNFPFN